MSYLRTLFIFRDIFMQSTCVSSVGMLLRSHSAQTTETSDEAKDRSDTARDFEKAKDKVEHNKSSANKIITLRRILQLLNASLRLCREIELHRRPQTRREAT